MSFERLVAAQALVLSTSRSAKVTRGERVLDQLIQLVLEKGAKHGLELPADVAKVVTISDPPKKKTVTM